MKLQSVAFLINAKKAWARSLHKELFKYFKKNGVKLLPAQDAQILITIGGDGTILFHKTLFHKPILGIGSDTSWICQCKAQNCIPYIQSILKHGFKTQKRAMLSSKLDGKNLPDALNEVVIRNREHRILNLRLFAQGKRYSFMADGIMFSTATGSAAYAYSCGGRHMHPLSKKFQIVAIAPYRRAFKPMIVDADSICELHVDSTCKADAVIDGQHEVPVKRKCCLVVKRSEREFEFVIAKKEPKK